MLGQPMFVTPLARAAVAAAPTSYLVSLLVAPDSVAELVAATYWVTMSHIAVLESDKHTYFV